MKSVLLIGLGKFGLAIARKLSELDQQIMAIDRNEDRVNAAIPFVTNAQIGDSTEEEFLKAVGARNYDVCIVAIGEDFQSSLVTVSMLKELGARKVVARAESDIQAKFLLRNGADDVVQPDQQIAEWISIRYTSEHVIDFVGMDADCSIFELVVPKNWEGKTLVELDVRRRYNVNVFGIRENGHLNLNLGRDTVMPAGAALLVIGNVEDMRKFYK